MLKALTRCEFVLLLQIQAQKHWLFAAAFSPLLIKSVALNQAFCAFYAPGSNDRWQNWFLSCLFVCLSVCLSVVNLNLHYNFWLNRDRYFIFRIHTLLKCSFKWHQGQWPCDLDFDLCSFYGLCCHRGIVFHKHMHLCLFSRHIKATAKWMKISHSQKFIKNIVCYLHPLKKKFYYLYRFQQLDECHFWRIIGPRGHV